MYVLLAILFSTAGIVMGVLFARKQFYASEKITTLSLWLALIVIVFNGIVFFGGLAPGTLKNLVLLVYNISKVAWFLSLGFLIGIIIAMERRFGEIPSAFRNKIIRLTILSASLVVSFFFFMVAIGKLRHAKEMEEFFVQSGYPAVLNYFIIAIECICSIGLLIHQRFKSGLICAVTTGFVMVGAIFTHLKNRDPVADSYDALHQLLILCFLIALYRIEKRQVNGSYWRD